MQQKKKLLTTLLVGYGGLMLLLIGMLTASMILTSNVLYMNSPIAHILDISITIVDIFAYAISATVLIYGLYLLHYRQLTTIYAAYFCLTVFHYVALLCIGWVIFPSTLPETVQDLFIFILEDVLLFVFLDCLRMFIIGIITHKKLKKQFSKIHEHNRTAAILGKERLTESHGIFPITSFISFKNPVQIGVFVTALVYWLTFYFQYIYIDILSLIKFDYVEGFVMQLLYLLLNAVLACICYCIMMYLLIHFQEKVPKHT